MPRQPRRSTQPLGITMRVVPTEPQPWHNYRGLWHLLEDGDAEYIYVNCEQSAVGFIVMIELTSEEKAEHYALGWTFLHYFALKINHWSSRFLERRVTPELQVLAERAIAAAEAGGVMPNTSFERTREG